MYKMYIISTFGGGLNNCNMSHNYEERWEKTVGYIIISASLALTNSARYSKSVLLDNVGAGYQAHLSPVVSLIFDLVHDSGILQSELFTSRSQNLV